MPPAKANSEETQSQVLESPQWFRELLGRMEIEATEEDPSFLSPMITSMQKILTAESEEDMWEADELDQTGGRDLGDIEQRILAYQIKYSMAMDSDIKSAFIDSKGRGMYLLVRSARLDNGEEFVWNTSAPLIVGKILWLADRSKLPHECVIREVPLGGGRKVIKLKPVPRRAVQTEAPF
jgi:hypothetical protein